MSRASGRVVGGFWVPVGAFALWLPSRVFAGSFLGVMMVRSSVLFFGEWMDTPIYPISGTGRGGCFFVGVCGFFGWWFS